MDRPDLRGKCHLERYRQDHRALCDQDRTSTNFQDPFWTERSRCATSAQFASSRFGGSVISSVHHPLPKRRPRVEEPEEGFVAEAAQGGAGMQAIHL